MIQKYLAFFIPCMFTATSQVLLITEKKFELCKIQLSSILLKIVLSNLLKRILRVCFRLFVQF